MLSSAIPTELGNLVKMASYFQLNSNSFSTAVPTELGNLNKLHKSFELTQNKLSSAVPTELGKLDALTSVVLNVASSSTHQTLRPPGPRQHRR